MWEEGFGGGGGYGLLRKQLLAPRRHYRALKMQLLAAAVNDGVRQSIIILSEALIDFPIGGVYCRSKTCENAALCSRSPLPVGTKPPHPTVFWWSFSWKPTPAATVVVQ